MQESLVFYMSSGITIKASVTQSIGYGASEVFGPGLARASIVSSSSSQPV